MEKAQARTEKELEELRELLDRLKKELGELNVEFKRANGELMELQYQAQLMEKRLNAASKLITGLTGERTRWTKDVQNLQLQRGRLFGDCLLAASFLSYAGAFTTDYRMEMIYDKFLGDVVTRQVPATTPYKLEALLTSDAVVQVRIDSSAPQGDSRVGK
jgi:dynein heavy chain, axonemal